MTACLDCGKDKSPPVRQGQRWCHECLATRRANARSTMRAGIVRWRTANRDRHLQHGQRYRQNMSESQRQKQRAAVSKYRATGAGRLRAKESKAKYQVTHKQMFRERKLKRLYGLTLDQYEALIAAQESVCAICKESSVSLLCVDHCHATGAVRGLLCRTCNSMLGNARDNIDRLHAAALYLQQFSERKDAA